MIERGGHYGRHYCTPAAQPPARTLRDWLRSIFHPRTQPEGRRRIIPGMPCDNHALGWSEMVYPDAKNP